MFPSPSFLGLQVVSTKRYLLTRTILVFTLFKTLEPALALPITTTPPVPPLPPLPPRPPVLLLFDDWTSPPSPPPLPPSVLFPPVFACTLTLFLTTATLLLVTVTSPPQHSGGQVLTSNLYKSPAGLFCGSFEPG